MSIGSGHISGPVFKESGKSGKGKRKSILFANPRNTSTNQNNDEVLSAKAFIARLEVQIDQSKQTLASLCDEMIAYLPIEKTIEDYELELIDQISRTNNICRMLMHENKAVQADKLKVLEDNVALKNEFNNRIREMEDYVKATVSSKEQMARDHYADTRQLREELYQLKNERESYRLNTLCLEKELESLRTKLDKVETKLLSQPRVEEQILKKAKQEISRKEISLNKREYKWKRLEAEVGDIKTWKDKADHLDATLLIVRRELEEQVRQNRLALRMYQRHMAVSTAKIRELTIGSTANGSRYEGEYSNVIGDAKSSSIVRPRPKSATTPTGTDALLSTKPPLGPVSRLMSDEIVGSQNISPSGLSTRSGGDTSAQKSKEKDMNVTLLEAKVSKLETENNFLLKKVKKLAKSLSNARAYPLIAVADSGPYRDVKHPPSSVPGGGLNSLHRFQQMEQRLNKEEAIELQQEQELIKLLKAQGEMEDSVQDDDSAKFHSSDDDTDDNSTTTTPSHENHGNIDGKTMDEVRDENHKRLQKMMMAIHGPKAKRLTFSPSSRAMGDDDHEEFDPQWQRQERELREARQARKVSLADDLRNRIDSNRKTRRPHSAAR